MVDPAVPRIVVASFRSPAEAAMARSAIEAAGIETSLIRDPTGIGIAVAAEHADDAVALLSEVWPEPHALPVDVAAVEVERCPECGSADLLRIRRLPFFIIFTTLMMTIGYAAGQTDLFALLVVIGMVRKSEIRRWAEAAAGGTPKLINRVLEITPNAMPRDSPTALPRTAPPSPQ